MAVLTREASRSVAPGVGRNAGRRPRPGGPWATANILSLQRKVGNAAAGQWVQRRQQTAAPVPTPAPAETLPVQRACACESKPGDRCDSCQDDAPVQRYATCTPARMSLKDCPDRTAGERQTAKNGPMVFLPQLRIPGSSETGVLIANFDIGSAAIKPNLAQTIYWQQFLAKTSGDTTKWRIEGFADCQGDEARNRSLREQRARAVLAILPPAIRARITATAGASAGNCITENDSAGDRTLNRSVALVLAETSYDMEPETITDARERQEPDTDGCSADQRKRLAIAYPLAKRLGEGAIAAISSMERGSPEEALLKKFFGSRAFELRFRIKRGYVDALRSFQGNPTYKCVPQGTPPCESSGTYGVTGFHAFVFGSPIVVCSTQAFADDDLELADTILHEASHAGDWTNDLEYCSTSSGCTLETTDQTLPGIGVTDSGALNNADSYARFASRLFLMNG